MNHSGDRHQLGMYIRTAHDGEEDDGGITSVSGRADGVPDLCRYARGRSVGISFEVATCVSTHV